MKSLRIEWLENIKSREYIAESDDQYIRTVFNDDTIKWCRTSTNGEYFKGDNCDQKELETKYQNYLVQRTKQFIMK